MRASKRRMLPAGAFALSSHALGLAWAIEMARALDRLPPALTVIGIEIARVTAGAPLSPAVADAAARLTEELAEALAGDLMPARPSAAPAGA